MNDLGITQRSESDRPCPPKKKKTGSQPWRFRIAKRRDGNRENVWLLAPTAALLINAIKKLAHIDKETKLIEPEYVQTDPRLEDQPFG